jgi:hypothetical protein
MIFARVGLKNSLSKPQWQKLKPLQAGYRFVFSPSAHTAQSAQDKSFGTLVFRPKRFDAACRRMPPIAKSLTQNAFLKRQHGCGGNTRQSMSEAAKDAPLMILTLEATRAELKVGRKLKMHTCSCVRTLFASCVLALFSKIAFAQAPARCRHRSHSKKLC